MKGERKLPGRKRPSQLVKGVPGGDCDSCSAWLLKNIRNKPKGCRAKVGEIARTQFEILLDGMSPFSTAAHTSKQKSVSDKLA